MALDPQPGFVVQVAELAERLEALEELVELLREAVLGNIAARALAARPEARPGKAKGAGGG